MSLISNSLLLGADAAAGGYTISRSLRFNSADSAYLSRTPASAGNRKTWTWAGWVKRAGIGSWQALFASSSALGTASNFDFFDFRSDNRLQFTSYTSTDQVQLITTQVFRDCSAWFHLVLTFESSASAASDRVRFYVNGSRVSAFDTATYPSSSYDSFVNAAQIHTIGRDYDSDYNNGYLADIHFIDGQALTPTSFGEFSATTGVWMPKRYAGTYGTNGFKLDFSDNSAATATTLGKDSSGNGNNWTPNNLSVTAGAGNDSLVDVPTNGSEVDTGSGGQVRGNYCTLNPLNQTASVSLSNGNIQYTNTATNSWMTAAATLGLASGKWYFEAVPTGMDSNNYMMIGVADLGVWSIVSSPSVWNSGTGYLYYGAEGKKYNGGANATYGNTYTNNDVIGVAVDVDNGKIWFSKNGTWQASGDPAAGTNAAYTGITAKPLTPVISSYSNNTVININFGQRPFAYTAPSGFKALCTANLPAPTIVKPSTVMDVKLYTGNGSTQTISGLGFSPDLVWIKSRSAAYNNRLYDQVRGVENVLNSNTTAAEGSDGGGVTAFTSTGFTLGSSVAQNENNTTYAAWAWDAGSSTVTNTQGSISSQVRANASAGFSMVTFTYSSAGTVGHGLGVAPSLIISKSRSSVAAGYDQWFVYHQDLGTAKYLLLNSTAAAGTALANSWGTPNSSTFGATASYYSSGNFVAYCFAPVAGYSSFGSYTGNGSSDGPFVYTGFRPRWLLVKPSSYADHWFIFDSVRSTYNDFAPYLLPSSSIAESSFYGVDVLSNGFKFRTNSGALNASGSTYIYAAFAESPFGLNNRAR